MPRCMLALLLTGMSACVLTTDFDGLHAPSEDAGGARPDAAGTTDGETPALTDPNAQKNADGGAEGGGDGGGAVDPNLLFADDFNRANGPVGNGWLDPNHRYFITDNQVPVSGTDYCFQCDTLYRPKTDDARDLKASVEFTPLSMPPSFPQVHIRSHPGDNSNCYAIGVPQSDHTFFFGRCIPENDFQDYGSQELTENMQVGRTYRLSISAQGDTPVHLVMMLEKKTESGYVVLGKTEYNDGSPGRVKEAGMYGISANASPNWIYDNFLATRLTAGD